MPFHLDPPKMFYSYTGSDHQKYSIHPFCPSYKCSIVLIAISQKVSLQKKAWVIEKKKERKKKNKCPNEMKK
jgi:hypothetical protein